MCRLFSIGLVNNLTIAYYDDNDKQEQPRKILQEEWTIDIATGKLSGINITDLTKGSNKKLKIFSADITNAIKA